MLGQLGLLFVVTLLLVVFETTTYHDGRGVGDLVLLSLEKLVVVLPAAAGIAVGLVGIRERLSWIAVAAAVSILILLQDVGPAARGSLPFGEVSALDDNGALTHRPPPPRWAEPGALGRAAECGINGGCLESHRDDSGRVSRAGLPLAVAYYKMGFLLASFVVVGISVAVHRWLEGAVVFISPSSETVGAAVATWGVPVVALVLVTLFADQVMHRVLLHGVSPVALLYPYLGLLTVVGLSLQVADA